MRLGLSTSSARARPWITATAGLVGPHILVERALRAGAAGLMLDDSLPPAYLAELRPVLAARRAEMPVWAVENVCPASRLASAQLCALDRDEAGAAVEAAMASIRLAAELGVGDDEGGTTVLLRLGDVAAVRAGWPVVRRAFLRAEVDDTDGVARLLRERDAHAPRHVDALRRSLAQLVRAAESSGVRLGLRNPARSIGLPSPIELHVLLGDLAGAPVAPALDLAAAHLQDAMAMRPLADTLTAWASAPMVLFADACGPAWGLPPGRGEIDLGVALAALAPTARVVFTPSPLLDDAEVQHGTAAVRALRP